MANQTCPVCSFPLDPSWPQCPMCLKHGRTAGSVPPPRQAASDFDQDATLRSQRPASFAPGGEDKAPTQQFPYGGPGAGGRDPAETQRFDRAGGGRGGWGEPDKRITTRVDVEPTALAWLIVKKGKRRGKLFLLQPGRVRIGADPSNDVIILDDDLVSGLHAGINVVQDRDKATIRITDFDSTNGTSVNGQRITATTEIVENDELQIGNTVFVLKTLG